MTNLSDKEKIIRMRKSLAQNPSPNTPPEILALLDSHGDKDADRRRARARRDADTPAEVLAILAGEDNEVTTNTVIEKCQKLIKKIGGLFKN